MGIFYRDQKVELQYRENEKTSKHVIYNKAIQVSIDQIPDTNHAFLTIRFVKDGVRHVDRYNMSDVKRFRLRPIDEPKSETEEPTEEVIDDEDHDN